ncbi:MAG: flavodoxin-dependent (E)-4-hydroxy-3-methylbut-2-enyl-diphosphate synthase [bacterium]|nr:flavodoxin-dependent (E)-4-hydroxy-3-methylbut-2-enyl-diphosphate synthase [bacterium]MDE0288991.1 flavodoxin-dependent (E)-4-hydroxy-3-methylbut-2-enyl-diphosphate synthase [bacterium]MDE0439915.1 flavodoxin-dependent (E)-4-hydroxy-3-methylbut-2-enyl-diphosphate synthase [bacterium]
MAHRDRTRQIRVGPVPVGGGAPVSVQSMTTTKTADVDNTLAQVYALAGAGVDIVRITCNDRAAAEGLAEMVPRSPVPIIADIHYQYRLALAALEAGVQGLRLNPGNIRKPHQIRAVAREAKDRGIPIRVGVNAGSLDRDLMARFGSATPEALVASALKEIEYLAEEDFEDIKISVKHSHVPSMVESYRLLADTLDYPLHLGVTEAGPPPGGLIKSVAGIATLLLEGIGDTIRFSLTADPVEEAKAGRQLLEYLDLRERTGLDLIACPSCGRAEVDVLGVAQEAQAKLEEASLPIQVAVMGCVVNGPGEAREADIGIAAGRGRGHLFIKGKVVRVVPEAEMVDALLDEARRLVEEGVEARVAAADRRAARTAERDRRVLLQIQGDANQAAVRRAAVAKVAARDG